MKLYTIGFTQKTAEEFFELLKKNNIKRVIDVRLNNNSQLAGFTKKNDLRYLLKEICQADYKHYPLFAPTEAILKGYKSREITWGDYEKSFGVLLNERKAENKVDADELSDSCLLCSESTPEKCHRRLVAEYFSERISNLEIIHL